MKPVGLFITNGVLPVANLKMGSLLYDVRNQKAAFLIEEGIFNNSIPGYSIRVKQKLLTDSGDVLKDIVIYDQSKNNGNTNVLMADEGEMYKTKDEKYFCFMEITFSRSLIVFSSCVLISLALVLILKRPSNVLIYHHSTSKGKMKVYLRTTSK